MQAAAIIGTLYHGFAVQPLLSPLITVFFRVSGVPTRIPGTTWLTAHLSTFP